MNGVIPTPPAIITIGRSVYSGRTNFPSGPFT